MTNISKLNTGHAQNRAIFMTNIQAIVAKQKTEKSTIILAPISIENRFIAKIDIVLNDTIQSAQTNAIGAIKLAKELNISDIQFDLSIVKELCGALTYLSKEHQKIPHNHKGKEMRQDMIEVASLLDINVSLLLNKIEDYI